MKTLNQWFDEYAVSHQNRTNQLIHFVCVPAIFFSIIGMIMARSEERRVGLFQVILSAIL